MSFRRGKQTAIILALLVLSATFASGIYLGYEQRPAIDRVVGVSHKEDAKPSDVDFAAFWEAWSILSDKYVSRNGNIATSSAKATAVIGDKEKVWGAIGGLAKSLGDPYTVFFNPEEAKIFESDIQGNFEGVGMEISIKDQILTVVAPLKASPSEKAGIKSGDRIVKIDGQTTADMTVEAAVKLIRGPKGTKVTVTIAREGESELKEIPIVRDVITIPTIHIEENKKLISVKPAATSSPVSKGGTGIKDPVVGKDTAPAKDDKGLADSAFVLRLYSFGAQSGEDFGKAINSLSKSGQQKLIIDLRGNPGGYLEAAVDMASWFVPAGKPIVLERSENKPEIEYQSRGYQLPTNIKDVKVVILVDRGSASASEILTGALSEYGVAKTVGERTFGKGSVQELVHLADGGAIKVTIARWYTPKGNSISQNGITPDYVIPLNKENTKDGADPQMAKALELLNQ